MSKREELNSALKECMKTKDQVGVSTIRLITAAIKDRDIDARGKGQTNGIDDAAVLSLMQSMIKQRQESSEIYRTAGRDDLLAQEESEIAVIKRFLPQQLDDAQVKKIIGDLISELGVKDVKDMGKLMGALKSRYAGQMDMAKASALVKEKIAG